MAERASRPIRVAVLGGGIIGISAALCALEADLAEPGIDVTVIAAEFTPYTTGDGSAGFWNPYLLGDMSHQTLRLWCKETFDYLMNLCNSSDANTCGVGMISAYELSEEPIDKPVYSDIFLDWRKVTERELQLFPRKYKFGSFYITMFAECTKLLPYMMKKIKERGGKLVQRKVNQISELIGEYDVVINCPGVEAAHLVPDPAVQPIRGQTLRVKAPWIKYAIIAGDFYILPNSEEVICGGTHQIGDWSRELNLSDKHNIWHGCCELIPSLKDAIVLKDWVGLRPGRSVPRLERETFTDVRRSQKLEVIHNYGHGGSGVTLCWGSAKEAVEHLKTYLSEYPLGSSTERLSSRL